MTIEELQSEYDRLLSEAKDVTSPIFDRLTGNPSPAQAKESMSEGIIHKPCGVKKRVPKLDPVQLDKARESQEQIEKEVRENPFEFPDAAKQLGEQKAGDVTGDKRQRIALPQIGQPKWVKELKSLVKGFGKPKRKRGREYYDIESLVRNVPEKEAAKKKMRTPLVFTILDTSGSMTQRSQGESRSILEEMAKFVPPIVSDYDGTIYIADAEIKEKFSNKRMRKAFKEAGAQANSLMAAGGGGTNFDKAYEDILRQKREQGFECLVIVLTDGGVTINPAMVQELRSSIIVMPKRALGIFQRMNRGALFSMIEDDSNYPAVRLILIDV